jgi:5-(carboxyamino)imidazole ribonucleotide mutase
VAAVTVKPVIGVPMDAGSLGGQDALLSTVQMPGGIPVACMAIGKAGARNAAYLAAQILALTDSAVAKRLRQHRDDNAATIEQKNNELQNRIASAKSH